MNRACFEVGKMYISTVRNTGLILYSTSTSSTWREGMKDHRKETIGTKREKEKEKEGMKGRAIL